jgi:hypothetical protein
MRFTNEVQESILLELANLQGEMDAAKQQVILAEEKSKGFIDDLWA